MYEDGSSELRPAAASPTAVSPSETVNLRRLTYFVAVAEELHFGRAAARLHMAQPPLSQQIQELERELGVRLFDRSTRSVTLTDAGRLLYPDALDLVVRSTGVRRRMEEVRSGEGGVLRLGFVDSASYEVLPRLLRAHRRRWPSVRFELRSLSSDQQVDALTRGAIDLGVARTTPAAGMEAITTLDERLVLAVPDEHRLAAAGEVSLADLADESFVGFDRRASPTLHQEFVALLWSFGLPYDPVIEGTEYTTILGLVAAGQGVAIVPASVQAFRPADLTYVELVDATARTTLVFLHRHQNRAPLLARAAELVEQLYPSGRLEGSGRR